MANFSMKIASTVSATAIVATSMSASLVAAASEFLPYAEALAATKVIGSQSTEAGYRLNDQITRAELAKVAANLGQYTKVSCTGKVYADVTASLGDLCDAIETLAAAKVISTSRTHFNPTANVTRAEMTKMLLGALGEKPSEKSAGYSDVTASLGDLAGFIYRANELGCARTATYFRPNANSSRGEAFKIASCAAKINIETPKKDETKKDEEKKPIVNGSVTVAAIGNAVAQYVPMNASSVNVGSFKVTATGGDVTISSITIARSGLGNSQNVTVSIADKTGRISESRTINTSTQESVVRLNNPITIKNGESVDLAALVSVNGQANAQHQFSVKAVNGQAVTPVTLGLINTTSYTTSTTHVDNVTLRSVTSGRNDQSFASVTLRAGNQDTMINGFTLTKNSGVDLTRAFANVKVYRNGKEVGKAMVTGDRIFVTELATDLARNNSATFDLRGDVVYVGSGSDSDDIVLNVAETEDVSASEKSTGFATQVEPYKLPAGQKIDLSSLDIVVTKKTNATNTIAPGSVNVTLLDGTISSSASFDVTKFKLLTKAYPNGGTANSVFSSLTLTVNGVDYDLLNTNGDIQTGTNGAVEFSRPSDKFRVEAGTPVQAQLRGTLKNNATVGNLQYELQILTAKNINTGNITELSGKNITGNSITISAPTLKVRQATVAAPSGDKISSNATDLEIGRFGVEAKADEVSVNKIIINNAATADAIAKLGDVVSNVRLINVADGSVVASSGTVEDTKITFNSVNLRVAKDTTANVKLVVDTNGDLVTNYGNKKFAAGVEIATADVSTSTAANATVEGSGVKIGKDYTVSSHAPTIRVQALPLLPDAPIARVTLTNTDPNADLTVNSAKIRVAFRSTANGTAPTIANVCIRNVGSSSSCDSGAADVLPANPVEGSNGLYTYEISGSQLQAKSDVSRNNGTTEFEVFIPNTPVWVAGDYATVSVTEVKYTPTKGVETTESYVGVKDASAQATK